MAFLNVRQLREQNLLRLAIFGKVGADKARLTHDLHGLVSLLEIFLIKLQIVFRDFAFAIQVVIVKRKAGFQF